MKRRYKLVSWILIFCLASTQSAHGARGPLYQKSVASAKVAVRTGDYPKALFFIHAARLADPAQEEPAAILATVPPFSQDYQTLKEYYDLGTEAYYLGDYEMARFYFNAAYNAEPFVKGLEDMVEHVTGVIGGREEPLIGPVRNVLSVETQAITAGAPPAQHPPGRHYTVEHPAEVDEIIGKYQGRPPARAVDKDAAQRAFAESVKREKIAALTSASQAPQPYRKTFIPIASGRKMPVTQIPRAQEQPAEAVEKESFYELYLRKKAEIEAKAQERLASSKKETVAVQDVIELDDELWSRQPGTVLEVEFGKSIILQGQQVERFLVFDEGIIDVQKKDKDSVLVTVRQRGSTLLHLWEGKGRWTFNIKGVVPDMKMTTDKQPQDHLEKHARPFRVSYSNNWNSFYLGDSIPGLDRQNLSFSQWVGVYGDTPYGFFDASGNFFKFEDSTENTGRTVGLSNADLGPFEDFSIRGWDASKRFSNLSLPGRYFRGVLFDTYSLDHNVEYTFLKGQDRANFRQISEDVTEVRKSYIEGGRITLFPESENRYSINYARGYGEERPKTLRDKVFSAEAVNKFGQLETHLEGAWDEEKFAELLLTKYEQDDLTFRVNVRDINPGFTTITSRPSGAGEVGGNIVFDYTPEGYQLSSNLDIYRDRDLANPEHPDGVNYDFGTVFGMPLTDTVSWNNSVFYSNTPQLVSPWESFRVNTTLTKNFEAVYERTVTAHVTASHQRSRYELTPGAEYDRTGLSAGIRFPVVKNLSYFLTYDYSWVEVVQSGEKIQPNVMNTGLSYFYNFGANLTGRVSTAYRNEEDTEGTFSFLSGTDTLRHNIGFSYRPSPEIEIFMDGSLRNVWREDPESTAYNDADIRLGMRTSWDTVFRWDPSATIRGTVYKDLNRNSKQDADEPGIEEIEIQLGRKMVKTDKKGSYSSKVRATEVKLGVNFDSVPKGYSLLSYLMKDIKIEQGKTYTVDFGFITRSGIYGVFFVDENNNGKYEDGEPALARARVKMDGREVAESDFEGVYHFYDVQPGEHSLVIEVNSLPLEYLPAIKMKNTIEVQEGTTYTFHIPLKKK